VASKGLARGRLFAPDGRLRPRTHGVTRRLIMRLVEETRRAYPRGVIGRNIEIGVLTYKAIHDALLDEWPLRAELAAAGVDLQVGYFGRDDRGTNRFEAVDGLAVIGDARPNLGDVEADCLLLRLDPETVMEARAAAVVVIIAGAAECRGERQQRAGAEKRHGERPRQKCQVITC